MKTLSVANCNGKGEKQKRVEESIYFDEPN